MHTFTYQTTLFDTLFCLFLKSSNTFILSLRLRILGNWEISGKFQNWLEAKPNAQSPLQKYNFGYSS